MMGSSSITLKEVGGASACGGLEAEGQEFFASCLRSFVPQDKLSDPQAKRSLTKRNTFSAFDTQYSNIPSFHRSMGFNSRSETLCQLLQTSRRYSPYLSKWAFPILTRFSPMSSAISLHLRAWDREVVDRSTKWNWGWKASSA
jgi:hypothetical protein